MANEPGNTSDPAYSAAAVTPADGTTLTNGFCDALYIGSTGNVACILQGDSAAVTFTGLASGTILPVRARTVEATGTTATGIVALYH